MRLDRTARSQYEEVSRIINELERESQQGALIVVEGKRDKRCLKNLGVTGEMMLAGEYKKKLDTQEDIPGRRVVLLMDFDREGRKLTKRLANFLSQVGVEVDLSYRRRLSLVVKNGLHEIEDIYPYFSRKTGGEIK